MSVARAEAELAELLVLELVLAIAELPDAADEQPRATAPRTHPASRPGAPPSARPNHARGRPMTQTHARTRLGLAPETQTRIEELFGGCACHRCGGPAARLVGERFYCASHFLRQQSQAAGPPRVYRCSPVGDA
jgi:hypothetical protein